MSPETQAVFDALPRSGQQAAAVKDIATRAGVPAWKARCALAVLGSVYRGSVETITPNTSGRRNGSTEQLYRRSQ